MPDYVFGTQGYWEATRKDQEQLREQLDRLARQAGGEPVLPTTSTLRNIFEQEVAGQALFATYLFTILVTWDEFGGLLTATILYADEVYCESRMDFDLDALEAFLIEHTPYEEGDKGSWIPYPRHWKREGKAETDILMKFHQWVQDEGKERARNVYNRYFNVTEA